METKEAYNKRVDRHNRKLILSAIAVAIFSIGGFITLGYITLPHQTTIIVPCEYANNMKSIALDCIKTINPVLEHYQIYYIIISIIVLIIWFR